MFDALLAGMDQLVFLEESGIDPEVVKRNPYNALFPADQYTINGPSEKSQLSRRYVLLKLLKKLLGALKTQVNKEIEKIVALDDADYRTLAELAEKEADLLAPADEEETDMVPPVEDDELEIVAKVDTKSSPCSSDHRRTSCTQVPHTHTKSTCDELHTYCKDCGDLVGIRVLKSRGLRNGSRRASWRRRAKTRVPEKCGHKNAHWGEGETGRIAYCADPKCNERLSDVQTASMLWEAAGLEIYGDKPADDEIQHFPSAAADEMET
jgi:hypothetical protein